MAVSYAYSNKDSITDLISDIKNQIKIKKCTFAVFFSSSKYDLQKVGFELEKLFPETVVVGSSTSGEIVSGKMLKNSLVVMAFDESSIKNAAASVVDDIKGKNDVGKGVEVLEKKFGKKVHEMDLSKYVGMILMDGLSGAEEKVMDKLGNLTDLIFIGGSAGDDLKFKQTFVFVNGKAQSNAAVLALLEPAKGFNIIKTQSFKVTDKVLEADEVNEALRTVVSFNRCPAAQAYAEAVGVPADKIAEKFMSAPVGLMIDDEPFVRSPQRTEEGKIVFYCNVKKGMKLNLLESTDIVKDTKKAIREVIKKTGKVSAIINFNCILRTLELEAKNKTEEYGALFEKIPTIGFSTYGEAYLGHINQTATMLVIE